MRITILGGAGFAGAHLAVHLARFHEVQVVDSLVRPGSEFNLPRLREAGIQVHRGDVRCPEDWVEVEGFRPEAIIDCAAQPSAVAGYTNPRRDFAANTFAVLHALEHCRQTGAGLILFSTNKVYPVHAVDQVSRAVIAGDRYDSAFPVGEDCPLDGGDRSLYGCSKAMADLMVQEWSDAYGFPVVCDRFSCLAGPWQWGRAEQGWVAWWVIAHRLGLPLTYYGWGGRQVRDVLAVEDLCALIEAQIDAMPARSGPEVFNVGGGQCHTLSLRECTEICRQVTGRTVLVTEEEQPRRADFRWYVSDISKVRLRYGWEPTSASDPAGLIERIDRWACDHLEALRGLLPPAGMSAYQEAAG